MEQVVSARCSLVSAGSSFAAGAGFFVGSLSGGLPVGGSPGGLLRKASILAVFIDGSSGVSLRCFLSLGLDQVLPGVFVGQIHDPRVLRWIGVEEEQLLEAFLFSAVASGQARQSNGGQSIWICP